MTQKVRRRFLGKHFERKPPRIDMLPLIDSVFLVLSVLLFSMLSMTVHRGIRVDLPSASAAAEDKKDLLMISILNTGEIYLNKSKHTAVSLKATLSEFRRMRPKDEEVYINADRNAPYETVVTVLDICKNTGWNKISLDTQVKP